MPAADPDATLRRLVELTERERDLLENLALEELDALHVERAPLLAILRTARPGSVSQALLQRLHAASAANELIARRQSRAIRERLAHIGSGRRAINAYAPGGGGESSRPVAWLDRAG
jgi:hypothetical protein